MKRMFGAMLTALVMHTACAATITESYDDPQLGKVVRTTTTVDEPNYKSRRITQTATSIQDLTPQQQAEFAEAVAQWSGGVLENGLKSGSLLAELAKINGLPFDEAAFQKQADEAAAFLKSGEGRKAMKKNLGVMLNMLPQMEAASAQMMQQMEQHNRKLQRQLEHLFAE